MAKFSVYFYDEGNCDIASIDVVCPYIDNAIQDAYNRILVLCGRVTLKECVNAARVEIHRIPEKVAK